MLSWHFHSICPTCSWDCNFLLSPLMCQRTPNLKTSSIAPAQDQTISCLTQKLSFSSMIYSWWSSSMMVIIRLLKSSVISFLPDSRMSTSELLTISVLRPCISSPLRMKNKNNFHKSGRWCLSPTRLHVLEKISSARLPSPISSWDPTFLKTSTSQLVNSRSRPPSLRTSPITSIRDIYTTWVESRPSNSSTLNLKPDSFRHWEKLQRSGPKPLEFKFKNSRLLLSSLWVKFQTDKSSPNLSSRNHFLHTSKLSTA